MKFLLSAAFLALATTASAQTPFATENVGRPAPSAVQTTGASAANPWLGAQVAYRFGGTNELADNLIVSAHIIYELDLGSAKFHLPVMGNFSNLGVDAASTATTADQVSQQIETLLSSSSGMRFGVYPYYILKTTDTFTVVVHGELAWKINSISDQTTSTLTYLNQFRSSGGVEFGIGKRTDGKLPATVSLTPVFTKLSTTDAQAVTGAATPKTTLKSFEITGVLPIAPKLGVLFEGVLGQDSNHSFRAGIVIATGDSKS